MSDVSGYGSASPQPDPAEKARRSRRAKIAVGTLLAIAAVAFAAGWNPPTKTVHEFTEASDYNPQRESGCTNSGKGCHDAESSYKDFNDYHPNAECTTCHEYQGVGCIPCHMPAEVECQLCHDGTFEPAPDRVRLSDPYPKGHYRESTHTAMGTDFSAPVRGAEGGDAAAPCESCHSRDLAKSHTEVPSVLGSEYGESVGCGECHNDVRAFGQAEVLDDWKKRSCEECHKKASSSPMHDASIASDVQGTGALECGSTGIGCHDVNNLHVQHADAPKNCAGSAEKGESACHVLGTEALSPTATSCGGADTKACHKNYTNTEYTHKKDAELHAPTSSAPAANTSFYETPCGACHRMGVGGTSLTDEHAIATSIRGEAADVCANCHNTPASLDAIQDDWSARDTHESCSACHGQEGLPEAHVGDLTSAHASTDSEGCAESGAGCHPTGDLMAVGAPITTASLHADCLVCHDWTESEGNLAYDPDLKSCGTGRDCHAEAGAYDPVTSVHAGAAGLTDGTDGTHHAAGTAQADARYVDDASGVSTACRTCHSMVLGEEHAKSGNALSTGEGTLCIRCHNRSDATANAVKASWSRQDTSGACATCHGTPGVASVHENIDAPHQGIELAVDGSVDPGACTDAGCHGTAELRVLHAREGCVFSTCHDAGNSTGGVGLRSCGGIDSGTGCHVGYSTNMHFVEHAADLENTVKGIGYVTGQNVGCFGCHYADLVTEHDNARLAGTLDSAVPNACAICHESEAGGVSGAYASTPAVRDAIATHDRRCASCHASGTTLDTSAAVASAHRTASAATTLAAGMVWADPFDEWKAAFDALTGSGHNVLSAELVGGAVAKNFPLTSFELTGSTFTWSLPKNSGATQWLRPDVFGVTSLDSDSAIQHLDITCSDCHVMPDAFAGPQGAAVSIHIDPEYSQTGYANPTADEFQFKAQGTARVICAKCHTLLAGSVEGTSSPGGSEMHGRHVEHLSYDPAANARYWGEKCIDCHVRIPHAWKRPRLLIRTVEATDGAQVDEYPYVASEHEGLVGVRLKSFVEPNDLTSGSCVTGGCHPGSSTNRHPEPSDVPTAAYWP